MYCRPEGGCAGRLALVLPSDKHFTSLQQSVCSGPQWTPPAAPPKVLILLLLTVVNSRSVDLLASREGMSGASAQLPAN